MKLALRLGILLTLLLAVPAYGWLGSLKPSAAIENPGGTFNASVSGGVLHDVVAGSTSKWITASSLTSISGYAHSGQTGLSQSQANARVTLIQIWGWRDSNGNGQADAGDARHRTVKTTRWTKLAELTPSAGSGDVVGWEVDVEDTASEHDDILQGGGLAVGKGESWLLLVRCVNTSGDTNLMASASGVELWDDGDTSNGIGSDAPGDKYLDADGNTPGDDDGRVSDTAVVWIYRGR